MFEWVKANGFVPVVIATKLDKIGKTQVNRQVANIRKVLGADKDVKIIPFSAETKQGRDDIWNLLDENLTTS